MNSDQHTSFSDLLVRSDGSSQWNVCFTRDAQDWELDDVSDFFSFLYSTGLGGNEREMMLWKPMGSKKSMVCSYYKVLTAQHSHPFPWKCI